MKKNFPFKNVSSKSKFFLIKAASIIFTFHFSLFSLHSQTPLRNADLARQEPSWQAVIGGNAVSPCIETSYGIALLSDGRLLSACTNSGVVIWQRSIKGRSSPYLASFGDFLYVVTDSSTVNLVNPSGLTLWSAKCPFKITDFPVVGRDGRVFVRGNKAIACFGLDGKRKWIDDIEEVGNLPISVLDDGSLLLFLKKARNNQTVAKRFSPFGEKLEDITFTATLSSCESCDKGVLVSLSNGSVGLVTVENGEAGTKWVNGSGNSRGAFKICYSAGSSNAAFFFQNGSKTETVIVRASDGKILKRFQVGQIAPSDFKLARATQSGYFISGAYTACEFLEDGTIMYAASLPQSSSWSSLFYTSKNYIILCMKDWTMKAFLMNQTTKSRIINSKLKSISYIPSIKYDPVSAELGIRPLNEEKMSEISAAFKKGDYGELEKEYLTLLKTEAENYINAYATQTSFSSQGHSNFFSENAVYTQNLLYLMGKTGCRDFSTLFARLLQSNLDSGQLLSVIAAAGNAGYDEGGQMLSSLEKLVMGKIQPSQTVLLKAVCDSTYEICRYMGRPALNKQGKNIISHLFYPQYDKNVRDYARTVLTKMIDLEKK
ncbi:PQQ-binding-like beta-propeller repeat protein [Treponema sp.]|uniref:outer membrane protein assembly factor BamB family protein n=1 Tax=Treponema sp. TaxID=166 RepID=UPI0025F28F77|nr:PQQ-binding-like beta-propeller repeat protein [Treponema sp.]MBR4323251.1 hypothetical protein [Treponema sp.]